MTDFTFSKLEYKRPDYIGFNKSVEQYTEQSKKADTYQEFKRIFLEFDERMKEVETMSTIAYIRNTLDTTDEFYEKEIAYNNEMAPVSEEYYVAYYRAILESTYVSELEKEYGKQLIVKLRLSVDSFRSELIPYLQKEAALTTKYQKLMAMANIPFHGEELNLYGIQKEFENPDRAVRKEAFQAYSNFYHEKEEEMEQIFDELIEVRNKMGQALGYENFIPLGYKYQGRTDYGQVEVATFREQVRTEIVPLCEKLYKAQAKRIGVDGLKVYDEKLIFPDKNAEPIGDEDFLVEQARKMYHAMSKETGEFIDFMTGHEMLDLKNKKNKASTGYMTAIPTLKAPFVFSCFNHTIFDMQVLSHELGHAFAGYEAMHHQPINEYYSESTDIAEIHSMAMEQFAYPYAELFFGEDADKFRFAHLQEAITFVPFGVAVDEFQHIMYANPELTPKERTYEWHKLEQKYMPWRVYEEDEFMERGGYWYHKLHIFLYPFYYINYTLTTMGAMEFKKRYEENREEAFKDYLTLCQVGGSLSYLETLKAAKLSTPFEEGSVKKAISYAKDILLNAIQKEKVKEDEIPD